MHRTRGASYDVGMTSLAHVVLVGVITAGVFRVWTAGRVVRPVRFRVARWLAARSDRSLWWHARYAAGCWECGPVWVAAVGHAAIGVRTGVSGEGWWTLGATPGLAAGSMVVSWVVATRLTTWAHTTTATVEATEGFITEDVEVTVFPGDWPDDAPWPPPERD